MVRASCAIASVVVAAAACGESLIADPDAPIDGGGSDAASFADAAVDGDATVLADAALPCPDAACGTEIATGQLGAAEVVVDELRVYWTLDVSGGAVMARALDADAGAPYAVAEGVRPRSLTREGAYLYFGDGENLKFVDRDATKGTSIIAAAATGGGALTSGLRTGDRIFYASGSIIEQCTRISQSCNVATVGSHPVGPGVRALSVDTTGTRVWLATDAAVWSTDIATIDWQERWKTTGVRAITADETSVYLARDGMNGLARYGRSDAMGAAPVILAQGAPPAWALAMDGTHLFYAAFEQGLVVKVDKTSGAATVIASGLPRPKAIAERLDRVYVVLSDGRIVSLPKTP